MKNILILAVIAADIFKENPQLEQFHETTDGQAFFKELDAKNHAKTLTDKTVKTVKKGESQPKATTLKVEEVIAKIEAVTDLEALEPFRADTRKSVVAAIEKRTTELTPAE